VFQSWYITICDLMGNIRGIQDISHSKINHFQYKIDTSNDKIRNSIAFKNPAISHEISLIKM
jgi:hypothetical protein